MITYRTVLTIALTIAILYFIKVPGVVHFVDNILRPVFTTTNYIIDVMTHIRERHPYIYMSLFFILLFLMRPKDYN